MAKGNIAKNNVVDKIKSAFGSDWIGVYDKKCYVWADEGGEQIQVALSLTCPKTIIEFDSDDNLDLDFENMPPKPQIYEKAEISEEEQQVVNDLLKKLGL